MLLMRRIPAWRWRAAGALVAALAGLAAACGENRVTLDVDVRSFMNESSLVHPYDAPALVPLTTQIDPVSINLIEGYQDFGDVESATLDVAVQYDNTTGEGTGRFTIYFADDASTTFSTPPVATVDVDLAPATVTPGSLQIPADARVLDLLARKTFWMGVRMEWTPTGTEPLQGTLHITEIRVRLVSIVDVI